MKILFIDNCNDEDREFNALYTLLKSYDTYNVSKSNKYENTYDLYITNGAINVGVSSAPVILYITQNPFVGDIESFVYNKENQLDWLHTSKTITHIWIQSHYDEYKVYLETIYKLPVTTVQFTYNIYDISEEEQPESSTKHTAVVDIVLHETNHTFNTSSLKLLYICQEYYNLYPTQIGTVYLLNMPDHDTSYKLIESFGLWKDKKLRIFKQMPDRDILSFFKKNPNRTIFLSNTILNNIDAFMYDLVYNNILLMHTQKEFPYGVYYDKNDIKTCIQLIHDPSTKNKQFSKTDIENYNASVKTHYTQLITSISSRTNTQTINVHEYEYNDINDLSKPLVISYDNAPTENTRFYINTLKKNKWEYVLIGKGEKWEGWTTRMRAYMNILKTLPPNKLVVLTDARDVICCRGSSAFMDAFASFSRDIIVCMEIMCGNQIEIDDDYIGLQCHPLKNYWKYHSYTKTPSRKYVNNGLIAGKVSKLIEILQYGIDNKYTDDQFSLGSYVNKYPAGVGVDTEAELFHTTCFGAYSGMLDINLQKTDSPTFAELFGRAAFFLHIPGIAQIKGAKVVYKTVKALVESGIHDTLLREGYNYPEPAWILKNKNVIIY
jgi:hypothetical protein